MLAFQEFGTGGTPLIIAHGLFGSGRNWGVIAKRLAESRRVITVDMRNHARSFWDPDHSYAALAGDLQEVIARFGTVDLLGHSMGGKAAMVAALNGAPIRKLIVADIAPVAYGHTQLPLIEAMQALDLSGIEKRSDADAALVSQIPDPTTRAFLLQSLDVKTRTWRLNLDILAEQMPDIIGFPDISGSCEAPALFLAGATSDYVLPEARPRIRELFPNSRFAKIPGAGHWLHAEKPREFEAAVRVFLDQAQ
ncbi:alpha/beta fold hydrolase [Shimia ponticola]|uniref:alpha/beta fold hydrolase n=1 Tax=Shimia ponticola TaxID=2582893 RepID=UPI0011BEC2ED|nr:alpha/beta fold hydrolase [Shimia ponticola]